MRVPAGRPHRNSRRPAADLASLTQALERFDGFFKGVLATPMQQIQINVVRAQAPEAGFTRTGHALLAGVVRVDLAHQEHLVAPAADGFADDFLGAPLAIHLGGVDEGHALVDPQLQCRDFGATPVRVFAHAPGALADDRDGNARQINGAHDNLLMNSRINSVALTGQKGSIEVWLPFAKSPGRTCNAVCRDARGQAPTSKN